MIYHIEGEAIGTCRQFTGGLQAMRAPINYEHSNTSSACLYLDPIVLLFVRVLDDAIFIGEVA